jgi:NAD(P)-binding Rossmann-like domain
MRKNLFNLSTYRRLSWDTWTQDRRPERAALGLFLEVDRMSHSSVFVIGAGPAGLTSAYLLTKQGISTTVIEADPTHVGGISRTASSRISCSTSAVTASSPNRRRWWSCGTRSCPTTSSAGRACRASTTTATTSPIR